MDGPRPIPEKGESLKVKAVEIKQEPSASPDQSIACDRYQNGGIPRSWLNDFPWLEYVDGELGGVCKVCIETGHDGKLTSIEHHDLLSHAWSIAHQEAEALKEQEVAIWDAHQANRADAEMRRKYSKNLLQSPNADSSFESPESRSHRYEQHRVRRFCKHWLSIYKWLHYDAEENIMFCKVCRKQNFGNNSFVQGSRCFKRDTLRAHDLCKEHMLALNAESLSTAISNKKALDLEPRPTLSNKAKFLLQKLLKYFPWLLYNSDTQVLICDTCQRHSVNTLYVDCTQGMDYKVIQQHLESKRHQTAMEAEFQSWHMMYDMASEQGGNLELEEMSPDTMQNLSGEVFIKTEPDASPLRDSLCVGGSVVFPGMEPANTETQPMDSASLDTHGHDDQVLLDSHNTHKTPTVDSNQNEQSELDITRPRLNVMVKPFLKNNFKGRIQPTFGRFKPEWKREFPWVQYDKDLNVMVCMLCKKHKKKNSFVRGIRVFLRSFITHHIKSVKHRKATDEELAADPDSPLLAPDPPPGGTGRLLASGHRVLLGHISAPVPRRLDSEQEMDIIPPTANGWHVNLASGGQQPDDLTGRCQEIINSVMDHEPHRADLMTTDSVSHDSSEYTDHLRNNGPYDDESITGGLVVLERKKDGTVYKRVRKFRPGWLKDFPWLQYSRTEDVMRCTICLKHNRSSAFTKGTRTFHLDNVKKHEGSTSHQKAVELEMY